LAKRSRKKKGDIEAYRHEEDKRKNLFARTSEYFI
jgi:hypothetical protein